VALLALEVGVLADGPGLPEALVCGVLAVVLPVDVRADAVGGAVLRGGGVAFAVWGDGVRAEAVALADLGLAAALGGALAPLAPGAPVAGFVIFALGQYGGDKEYETNRNIDLHNYNTNNDKI